MRQNLLSVHPGTGGPPDDARNVSPVQGIDQTGRRPCDPSSCARIWRAVSFHRCSAILLRDVFRQMLVSTQG